MVVKTYSPKHRVTLFPVVGKYTNEIDMSKAIVSIHVSKQYETSSGGWQLMMTWAADETGKRWDQKVEAGDMVLIELSSGATGSELTPVMRGIVERVAMTFNTGQEASFSRGVKITGQDLGKLLHKHIAFRTAHKIFSDTKPDSSGGMPTVTVQSQEIPELVIGTPGEMVKGIFDKIFIASDKKYGIDPAIARFYTIEPDYSDDWNHADNTVLGHVAPVWDLMKTYSNCPYNVLYTETNTDGQYVIYHERRPFDSIGKLESYVHRHEVSYADMMSMEIGKDDNSRTNYLLYKTHGMAFVATQNEVQYYFAAGNVQYDNVESIRLHGLYEAPNMETIFVPPAYACAVSRDAGMDRLANARSKVLWDWYKLNHTYLNGTIIVHGTPEISVGEGLKITDSKQEFLIEQYDHSYSVFPSPKFITAISVTRGQQCV